MAEDYQLRNYEARPDPNASLIEYIEQDRISPVVARTFPLERIAEAQAVFMSKQYVGKLVLTLEAPR